MSRRAAASAALVALLAAGWQAASASGTVSPLLLPQPAAVARALAALAVSRDAYAALLATCTEVLAALAAAALAALAAGFAAGTSRTAERALRMVFAALYSLPIIAFLPFCTALFGLGPASRVAFGALYALPLLALQAIASLGEGDARLTTMARAFGAGPLASFLRVRLPSALPALLDAARVSAVLCFLAVVTAEVLAGTSAGMGQQLTVAAETFKTSTMFAWIAVITAAGTALTIALARLKVRLPDARS